MSPTVADLVLTDEQQSALLAYWDVYDRRFDDMNAALIDRIADHPELGPLVRNIPEEQRKADSQLSREMLGRAIHEGEWGPYLDRLREQGGGYARAGLSFEAWFALISMARPIMSGLVVDEYGNDAIRLERALEGMGVLIDIVMATIGNAYLETKDEIISKKDEVVRELTISRVVLSSIGEAVVTTDPDGRIQSMNPAMERLIGVRENDAVGKVATEVYPLLIGGEPLQHDDRFLIQAMNGRSVVSSRGYDVSVRCADGHDVPVAMTAAPLVDEGGRLIGGVAVIRDVSHEREVDRMKSSLISTVSHELRTPLTMIEGFAELLVSRDLPPESAREAVEQIHASSQRLDRLIDDLLSVSRIDAGRIEVHRERVDLGPAIQDALAPFFKEREIQLDIDAVPYVYADREMLVRIMTNIVSNALKYSDRDEPVSIAARRVGSEAEITVTDRGIGMSEEDRERVFERFFRVERQEVRNVAGTGLGLFITKSLVELQGGRIWVDSTPGDGTTFGFSLPLPARGSTR